MSSAFRKAAAKKKMSGTADERKQRKWLLYLKAKTSQVNSGLDTEKQRAKDSGKCRLCSSSPNLTLNVLLKKLL